MIHPMKLTFTYEAYEANKEEIDKLLEATEATLDGRPFLGLTLYLDTVIHPEKTAPPQAFIDVATPEPEPEQMWEFYERNPILRVHDQGIMKKLADWLYRKRGCHLSEDVGVHVRHDISARPLPKHTCFEIIA